MKIARLSLCLLLAGALFAKAEESAPPASHRAVVISFENDKFFAGSDRHYTQGARVSFLYDGGPASRLTRGVNDLLAATGLNLDNAKLAISIGQDMFTPTDTTTATLVTNDRPYAAWLYAALGFHAVHGDNSFIAEVSLGVVGPSALGEEFQNGWHDVINVAHSNGWGNQLHDEPGLNLALEWRRRLWRHEWFDVTPRAAVVLGNVHTHLSLGSGVRLGWRLPDDFGHDLIRSGSGNVAPGAHGFGAYAFAMADVRAVARNIFLDGNTWRSSHSVEKRPVVADLAAGFALNWTRFRLIYSQNYRTKEFYGQPRRDVFGSVSLIALF